MIDEIRNYHYDPAKFHLYKQWAIEHAVPFLKANLDIVGFWMDTGLAPELSGPRKMELPLGSANITWIIRWKDMKERNEGHARVFQSKEWLEVWAKHPDQKGYLQMEAKFHEAC